MDESEDSVPNYWGKGMHKDDILCMSYQDPDVLITASYDGDIIVWDICTQQVIFVVNSTDTDSTTSQYFRLYSKLSPKTKKRLELEKKGKFY